MQRQWKPTKKFWTAYKGLYGDTGGDCNELPAPPVKKRRPKKAVLQCASETQEQFAVVAWLKKSGIPHHHSPNGGQRSAAEGLKFKRLGTSAGFPDLWIPKARKGYHGLYIELKRVKGGILSDSQKYWRDLSLAEGYAWFEAKGAGECIALIKNYLGLA